MTVICIPSLFIDLALTGFPVTKIDHSSLGIFGPNKAFLSLGFTVNIRGVNLVNVYKVRH